MCITRRRTKQEVYNSRICVVEVHTQQKSGGRGGGGGCFGGGGGGGGDLRDDDDYEDSNKTGRNQGHGVGAGESGVKNDGASPGDATIGGGGNNIKGGGNQNHDGGAARNGGKNDGMTPGDAETIKSSGGGGENNIWGRESSNQLGDHGAAKNGGIYNGMSPGDSRYTNIGGGNRRENEDANSGTGGGGRNHNGHVSKTAEGGGGNMSHTGPTDSSDAKSSHTSVDELPRDVMGSTKAYRHEYAGPQSEINYAPAPVMQPYPVVNSYVHFFGEKKTKGCSIM